MVGGLLCVGLLGAPALGARLTPRTAHSLRLLGGLVAALLVYARLGPLALGEPWVGVGALSVLVAGIWLAGRFESR